MGCSKVNAKNESDTKHAPFIPESSSDKLYNSIVRIEINDINIKGTGFFLKMNINDNNIHFLITCNHIITNNLINSKNEILIYFGKQRNEKKKNIVLDKNVRYIKSFKDPIDLTLIEIIAEDEIPENKFLNPDLNYKNGFNLYNDNFFYLAGYPNNGSLIYERCISSGKIIGIGKYEFKHTLDTRSGSSGSPICTRDTINVIGIHKKGDEYKNINFGIFLGLVIEEKEFIKEKKKKGRRREKRRRR